MPEPVEPPPSGVAFPVTEGRRSTSAFGRQVLAQALAGVDETGRRAVLAEADWRGNYLTHFRRVLEAGLGAPADAVAIARAGSAAVADGMRWVDPVSGEESPLADALGDGGPAADGDPVTDPVPDLVTERVTGSGEPVTELSVPYRGRRLTGAELAAQLDRWVAAGVIEPGAAQAVRTVIERPEWLSLPGRVVVALGAGAEIGPTPTLLRWGATVAGVDLPRPDLWRRVLDQAGRGSGTLLLPACAGSGPVPERAGVDLLTALPALARWTAGLDGADVLGNYLYADGATNVRVSAAGDALAGRLARHRAATGGDLVQAYLATPTDVFAVPGPAVRLSTEAHDRARRRAAVRAARALSAGRLLRRAHLPGADPGVCDSLVAQQGPNYALAKRMQRWRATTERAAGRRVSLNVAPPTRTRSVLKNRALAAAYAGAHRFGVEVFDPSTTRVLMAALLVHDLCAEHPGTGPGPQEHPWRAEAHQAVHGGLWTAPFTPRSALGLAAVLGLGAGRS